MKISHSDAVTYLSSLSQKDFVDTFYEATTHWREDKQFANGEFEFQDVPCLAIATFGAFRDKVDDKAEFLLAGLPAPEDSGVDWGEELVETGGCSSCNSEIVSVAKLAVCPICSIDVECS